MSGVRLEILFEGYVAEQRCINNFLHFSEGPPIRFSSVTTKNLLKVEPLRLESADDLGQQEVQFGTKIDLGEGRNDLPRSNRGMQMLICNRAC